MLHTSAGRPHAEFRIVELDSPHGRDAGRTALRPTGRRRRRRRASRRFSRCSASRPHLVRRRLSGSLDVPARARRVAARRVRGERRDGRVPVRADARPRGSARRDRRSHRGDTGTSARGRRAPDRERRDRRRSSSSSKTFLDAGDVVVIEAPTYLGAIMAFRGLRRESSSPCRWTSTGSRSTSSSGGSPRGCGRSSSTRSPTTRTRRA